MSEDSYYSAILGKSDHQSSVFWFLLRLTPNNAVHPDWKAVSSLPRFPPASRSIAAPTHSQQADCEHLPRRTVQRPFLPHTPVAPACATGRRVERRRQRSVLRALADWLPPPKVRSPLVLLVLPGGLPSCLQTQCSTARHHQSRLCKDSVHWCRGRPNILHAACVHSVRSGGVLPEDPGRRVSPPSIRPPPGSPNCAAPFADSLRMWPSQYNLRDDRG